MGNVKRRLAALLAGVFVASGVAEAMTVSMPVFAATAAAESAEAGSTAAAQDAGTEDKAAKEEHAVAGDAAAEEDAAAAEVMDAADIVEAVYAGVTEEDLAGLVERAEEAFAESEVPGETVRKPSAPKTVSQNQADIMAKVGSIFNISLIKVFQIHPKWRKTDGQKEFSDSLGGDGCLGV